MTSPLEPGGRDKSGESSTEGANSRAWMASSLPTMLRLSAVFFLASSSVLHSATAEDRLPPGRPLSINQTIVSSGGAFALGFFSPGGSRARRAYVGIWYNNIPGDRKTVVWVANRRKPLMDDSGGVVTIAGDGNIVLVDGSGGLLWSSNVSGILHNRSSTGAVLLDTGNLVLRGAAQGEGDILWQSFDHPTDTMLPEMPLRLDVKSGAGPLLVSWRAPDDPSPGDFSIGVDPDTYMQIKTWRGSETWARGRPLDGKGAEALRKDTNTTTSVFVRWPEMNSKQISTYFTVMQGSPPMRVFLDHTGRVEWLLWDRSSANWSLVAARPSNPCDYYNRCGPSGLCNSNGSTSSLDCSCLRGFEPLDQSGWEGGNFSGGCVRRVALQCDPGDKFLRLGTMRVPDKFVLVKDVGGEECEAECLRRCNCTAYSYSNMTSVGSRTRCLIWAGELLDLRTEIADTNLAYDLNVRLLPSELGDTSERRGALRRKTHVILVITFATLGAVLMLSLGFLVLFLKRRSRRKGKKRKEDAMLFPDRKLPGMLLSGENGSAQLPLLQFNSVLAATDNFSLANKLGEGGFGSVYKGRFPDGEVAVKRLSKCSGQGLKEFKNEAELIAGLQHKNIVQLLGWCSNEDEKILIYEYLPNRSVDKFIFDPSRATELDWGKRFHIINGIAHGLLYLHHHSRLHVVHRDLKTSNILLDGAMNAKISDFGLARMFSGNQAEANTDRIVGTYGYMSPEYALDGHFSEKSDVFSFGVILLEIISGRRNTRFYPYKESLNLLGHAWKLWNEDRGLELMDVPSLGESRPILEQVSRCMHVALICVQEAAAARPTTSELVGMLGAENVASLPKPRQPAFLLEHGWGQEPRTTASINFVTLSSVHSR